MGEFKVWVDNNGIIRGKIIGVHTEEDAIEIIKQMDEYLMKEKGSRSVMIDMRETGRPTSKSRKVHAENIKNNSNKFKKAAFFGAKVINRVMANFIIKASGRGEKVRYFDTESDAVKWILE